VSVTVGTILLLSSLPHTYDAINIYNDGLDAAKPWVSFSLKSLVAAVLGLLETANE
jgi:hypothetical protein